MLILYKDMSYLRSLNILISLSPNITVVKYSDSIAWGRMGTSLMQMIIVNCYGNLCIIVMAVLSVCGLRISTISNGCC